ncbi:hypothetical protein ALC53_05819 [Atta colombica]|uniref:Uncharacterized protein n=1 Tax=Atta colombica TaxID=520822 RepID=A0A151I3A8_9HYME|nr:hypothetical protein ALC53_05819 [Atta colombica]
MIVLLHMDFNSPREVTSISPPPSPLPRGTPLFIQVDILRKSHIPYQGKDRVNFILHGESKPTCNSTIIEVVHF